MKNVIREGRLEYIAEKLLEKEQKPKLFVCKKCGCEFTATKKDYKFILYKFGFYSKCPTCANSVRSYLEDF